VHGAALPWVEALFEKKAHQVNVEAMHCVQQRVARVVSRE
jgi:hypothetical protein